jgi:hypothetical protein
VVDKQNIRFYLDAQAGTSAVLELRNCSKRKRSRSRRLLMMEGESEKWEPAEADGCRDKLANC